MSGDELRAAALVAVHDMAADWYCPFDAERQRVDCPDCIADVAVAAVLALPEMRRLIAAGEAVERVRALIRDGERFAPDDPRHRISPDNLRRALDGEP